MWKLNQIFFATLLKAQKFPQDILTNFFCAKILFENVKHFFLSRKPIKTFPSRKHIEANYTGQKCFQLYLNNVKSTSKNYSSKKKL